jgi:hypothetical protein
MVTMWSDANTAPLADEFIQIGLRNPDGAAKPMSYDRSAMNQSSNCVMMESQFGGDFRNG